MATTQLNGIVFLLVGFALVSNELNVSNAIYITGPTLRSQSISGPNVAGANHFGPYQQQQQQQQTDAAQMQLQLQPQPQLQMQQMQPPSITPFWFNSEVQENHRLSVLCVITSGDLPVSISWLKDGQLLSPQLAQARKIVIKSDDDQSTLKFQSVKLEHAGNYTCMARNRAGTQSHTAPLVVHGEPRWLKEPQHEPIVATSGQTIVIDCQTTGWPKPQQTWQIKRKFP